MISSKCLQYINTPIIISSNTTLSINQFIEIIKNGLIVNNSLSNVIITLPDTSQIIKYIPINNYQSINFLVTSIVNITPNYNLVKINGDNKIISSIIIKPRQTRIYTLTCINTDPPLFYL